MELDVCMRYAFFASIFFAYFTYTNIYINKITVPFATNPHTYTEFLCNSIYRKLRTFLCGHLLSKSTCNKP